MRQTKFKLMTAVLALSLVLAACGTATSKGKSTSSSNSQVSSFLAFPSIPATDSGEQLIVVPVKVCPTFSSQLGQAVSGSPQPSTAQIYVGKGDPTNLAVYTDANGSSVAVGPKGWSCQAMGASEGYGVYVLAPGVKTTDPLDGIAGQTSSSSTHSINQACAYIAAAAQDGQSEGYPSCSASGLVQMKRMETVGTSAVVISSEPGHVFSEMPINAMFKALSIVTYATAQQNGPQASVTICSLPSKYRKYCRPALINTPGLLIAELGPFASTTPTTTGQSSSSSSIPPALQTALNAYFSSSSNNAYPLSELSFAAKISSLDPTWAVYGVGAAPGYENVVQGASGEAHLVNGAWQILGAGSDGWWCNTGMPDAVANELGVSSSSAPSCSNS
jgi:predicted small secreted protein